MRKYLLLLLFIGLSRIAANAQDPHFSQYFASPLTLNPAATGFFDGELRLAVNQRQQWWNVGPAYSTVNVAADIKILNGVIPENDVFAIGVNGMFDKSLNGALKSNYGSVSGAYHKSLAFDGSQTLGVGFQVTLVNRYLDYSNLTFASQFNRDLFDPTLPATFNMTNSSSNYVTINTGILYAAHVPQANLYAGASLYHVNKPTESLFSPVGDQIPMRITAHGGGEVFFYNKSSVLFSGMFMSQAQSTDMLIGGAYGLQTADAISAAAANIKVYMGFWYRVNDAYIPYVGLDYGSFSAGVNYSMPNSSISTYSPRTFEFSLVYKYKNNSRPSLCPRF